jgi:hypothetical protein
MKFDRDTRELFTDAGELIKALHCPLRMRWDQLGETEGSPHRVCSNCSHPVLNTSALSDADVLNAVRAQPTTCLCVDSNQSNVVLLPPRASKHRAAVDAKSAG